jgi:hypothetical protein
MQQYLLGQAEKVVAPVESGAQGLLPGQGGTRAAG